MREDYQETLERMFKDGFLLLYVLDEDIRLSMFNPKQTETFPMYLDHCYELARRNEGEPREVIVSKIIHQLNSTEPDNVRLYNIRQIIQGEPYI